MLISECYNIYKYNFMGDTIMKKLFSLLLSLAVMISACFCFTSVSFAKTYCKSVSEFQSALYGSWDEESKTITVNVKPGTYNLNERLVIFSNTILNCKGATLHVIYLTQKSTAKISKCTVSSVKAAPIYTVAGAKASVKNCKTSKSK